MTWAKMCKGDPYSFSETLLFSGFSFLWCKKKGVCVANMMMTVPRSSHM